jgi:thymidylate synthase ThyX
MKIETSARIVADTMGLAGARITTFEVTAPRFLLAEVNTHRAIARSAASSRAIPVMKRVEMVQGSPFVPRAFNRNKPGMQAGEQLDVAASRLAEEAWLRALEECLTEARNLAGLGVHKEHANRILEPWAYYTGAMTGSEWDWFFALRNHPEAQPEFRELAGLMQAEYVKSTPLVTEINGVRYHLPYVDVEEMTNMGLTWGACVMGAPVDALFSISAARCARISYRTFDGKRSTLADDLELCERLVSSGHLSPFDHPATADVIVSGVKPNYQWDGQDDLARYWKRPQDHRQLWGWIPRRVDVELAMGVKPRRDSFAAIPEELLT